MLSGWSLIADQNHPHDNALKQCAASYTLYILFALRYSLTRFDEITHYSQVLATFRDEIAPPGLLYRSIASEFSCGRTWLSPDTCLELPVETPYQI